MRPVTEETRSERTARLLLARLDALVQTAGRLPHPEVERLVELAAVATMRAVALQLLDAERAETLWREAYEREPALPLVELRIPARLAA